jgi:tetratricopeptide (TPR) repeat protein
VSLYYLRRFDESVEQFDGVIDSNPDFASAHFWKSIVLVETGKFQDAVREGREAVRLDGADGLRLSLAWVSVRSGDRESAVRIMDELGSNEKSIVEPSWVGLVRFELGDKEEAFRLFRRACRTYDTGLLYLRGSPAFEACQSDPRWAEIEKILRKRKTR